MCRDVLDADSIAAGRPGNEAYDEATARYHRNGWGPCDPDLARRLATGNVTCALGQRSPFRCCPQVHASKRKLVWLFLAVFLLFP